MKVEVLIYAYLAICIAMIGFNIVCIFVFRMKDRRLDHYSLHFIDIVRNTVEMQTVTDEHCRYMSRMLKRTENLMAFDKTLEELFTQEPEQIIEYLKQLSGVFIYLTQEYSKKDQIEAAYFPYIINKYKLFQGQHIETVIDMMLELVQSPSLYVRENALQAIYSIGNVDGVMKALWIINEDKFYHHPKMIADGLLNFTGDTDSLQDEIWARFHMFSPTMQRTLADYFRFSSPNHGEQMLKLLTSDSVDKELAYSCIRYFGKYAYAPAYPVLMEYIEKYRNQDWVCTAILASALAQYPNDRTIVILKELLHSENWHVRYNASQSLMELDLLYTDMIDVFEGRDRYAGEIMRYRFDQKKMKEREAIGSELVTQ